MPNQIMKSKRLHRPTFLLGVGAQKSGTTWLANQLERHPQFMMSPIKELHYWDRRFHADFFPGVGRSKRIIKQLKEGRSVGEFMRGPKVEQFLMDRDELYYKTYFETRLLENHHSFGEFSPSYCILTHSEFQHIRSFMQPYQTRALFLMRDPVSRIWSQCVMEYVKATNRGKKYDPYEAFECKFKEPAIFKRGDYKTTIQNLDLAFPESDRRYVFFEELFKQQTLQKLCDFIGIDMINFDVASNPNVGRSLDKPSTNSWNRVRDEMAPIYDFVAKKMGYLPEEWGS